MAARQRGLAVETFDVLLPEAAFQFFIAALGNEKKQSRYSYGFPDGDGDCNCVTWIERLGLPLLTGRMDEFIALPGRAELFEPPAFDRAVDGLKIKDQPTYQGAVLKLLQDDLAAVSDLRNPLGDLYACVTA